MDLTQILQTVKTQLGGVPRSNVAMGLGLVALAVIFIKPKEGHDNMASNPKTFPVVLKDGTEGRAVKVTAGNYNSIVNWLGEHKASLVFDQTEKAKKAKEENTGWDIPIFKVRAKGGLRNATVDDLIVKTSKKLVQKGTNKTTTVVQFIVVKAAKITEEIGG